MWANAQRDGHPAEHRCALYSTPQSFADAHYYMMCSNGTKTRNQLKFGGLPKLTKRSQPLVGRSSPYCGDIWRIYCCLTTFFPIVDRCLNREDIARQSCAMVPDGDFWRLFATCISASRVQHISDLDSKFTLEMWANAQRDGCPAEYRWRRKLWLTPTTIAQSCAMVPKC